MLKMNLKMIGFILALGACTFTGVSSFANGPVVYWNQQVLYAVDGANQGDTVGRCLNNEEYRNKLCPAIGQMIAQKFDYLKKNGGLPFEIGNYVDRSNFDAKGIAKSEGKVQVMVPVVVGDSYHRDSATFQGNTFYKYDVKTLVDLMFCEISEDGGVHVIYNVPMMAYATPGSQFEVTNPLDEKILAKQFFVNSKEAIIQDLDFPSDFAKYLSVKHTGKFERVYQVTDVSVCGFNEYGKINLVSGTKAEIAIKKAVADAFTSKFAKVNRNCIVMPSPLSGNMWQQRLAEYIQGFSGCADVAVDFGEEAAQKIMVDVNTWNLYEKDMGKYYDGHYKHHVVDIGMSANIVGDSVKRKALKPILYSNEYKIGTTTPVNMTLNWIELFALAADKAVKGK